MLVISILTVVWFVLHTVDCSCDLGSFGIHRFGPDCRFMCHCKNNEQCDDTTGECSSGCASFWYGPGCQYRDIAEGEFSEHSDNLDSPHKKYANLANDGNSETCSYTAEVNSMEKQTNPFWRVWLPTTERISELMILTKVEKLDHFEGFEVYVENVTANEREDNKFKREDSQKCYRHTGDAPRNESVKVLCENPVVGNQVRIQLGTFRSQLVLCDVKINGGRNLAFDRDISQTQSSGFTNPASNAVDGHDKQSVWIECSFTVVDSPLLKLDIGRNALIWYIRILPVKDKIKEHLRLQLADDKATLIEKTVDIYPQTQSANITLNTAVARYVTITNPGKSKRLQICELKVFGDCLEDECGFDCSKTCHCKYTNIWDKMDGKCSSGCKHGWAGFSCDHCGKGKYGQNCSLKCSDNCNYDGICNNVDGTCVYGCKPGYSDGKCEQECQSGSYGQNCSDTCPSGCNDGLCDNFNGKCQSGCNPGYYGERCENKCHNGKYGKDCTLKCSDNCKYDARCNNVDGTCLHGCKPGYSDAKCEQKCQSGKYGSNCLYTCASGCNDVCDNVDGKCQSGCKPGYYGERCENECSNGIYGQNCSKRCSDNCFDGSCSNVDGNCVYGCKPGYFDGKCEKECPKGKYGQNCDNTCSKSCTNGLCDNADGKCIYGCKPGYVGTKCEQKCDEGMYGKECIETCGYCLAGATCDHEIGTCLDGCAAGYHGQMCKSKCSDGHWGPDCISVCGHCADSSTCSIYTGTCPGACRPGWLQPLCIYAESHVEKDGQFHSVDIIIGPTVAVVTGVAVIITLLLVLKRRNSLKPEKQLEANDGTSAQDINEYERIDLSRVDVEHETQYTELQLYEYEQEEEAVVAIPK